MCEVKMCIICKEVKPLEKFPNRSGKNAHLRLGYCRKCYNRKRYERRMKNNPELFKKKVYERGKKNYNPEKVKDRWYRTNYGITLKQYDELCIVQENKCAICSSIPEKLVIDHNHTTGKIRQLLCHHCNTMLGYARENPLILQQAINYLLVHSS